jgi:SNF2 family DNA or RNA helicase
MDLSRFALYPHQAAGVEFLARRGRAILGDDMGLGKTRQAIIALRESAPTGVVLSSAGSVGHRQLRSLGASLGPAAPGGLGRGGAR